MSWFLSCIGCGVKKPIEKEESKTLDFQHLSLNCVPSIVFECERFLEELYLDCNQITELPKELFHCHELRVLSLSDNDLHSLPVAVSSLNNLQSLDLSKNGISDIPDNIKACKRLRRVNASTNPLCRLPEGFTQLVALRELCLNDTFLEYLPANFGRLVGLEILELRENQLNTLPRSITRLKNLKRLDLGQNEFSELPEVVGHLTCLTDLWFDNNWIKYIPPDIGYLVQLTFLDASKNRILEIDPQFGNCQNLTDVFLTGNDLEALPDSLCNCVKLTSLHVDDNKLEKLPDNIGSLEHLTELKASHNELALLPPSIGLMRSLQSLHIDDNFLASLPSELGSCASLMILTAAYNNMSYLPPEMGNLTKLRVLNLCGNTIQNLPVSFSKLQLCALWLSTNQAKPSVSLQCTLDETGSQKVLTCFMLPQVPQRSPSPERKEDFDITEEEIEAKRARSMIHFASDGIEEQAGRLSRTPTPYPKELRALAKHTKNIQAVKQREKDSEELEEVNDTSANCENEKSPLLSTSDALLPDVKVDADKQVKDEISDVLSNAATTEVSKQLQESSASVLFSKDSSTNYKYSPSEVDPISDEASVPRKNELGQTDSGVKLSSLQWSPVEDFSSPNLPNYEKVQSKGSAPSGESHLRPASVAIADLSSRNELLPRPGSLALNGPLLWQKQRPGSLAAPINTVGIPSVKAVSQSSLFGMPSRGDNKVWMGIDVGELKDSSSKQLMSPSRKSNEFGYKINSTVMPSNISPIYTSNTSPNASNGVQYYGKEKLDGQPIREVPEAALNETVSLVKESRKIQLYSSQIPTREKAGPSGVDIKIPNSTVLQSRIPSFKGAAIGSEITPEGQSTSVSKLKPISQSSGISQNSSVSKKKTEIPNSSSVGLGREKEIERIDGESTRVQKKAHESSLRAPVSYNRIHSKTATIVSNATEGSQLKLTNKSPLNSQDEQEMPGSNSKEPSLSPVDKPINQTGIPILSPSEASAEKNSRIPTFANSSLKAKKSATQKPKYQISPSNRRQDAAWQTTAKK